MFDITPDDIKQLNDTDLRELIGRLCEAELACRGLSPSAVTWGGSQTAADGGLDVRVALPTDVAIEGFVPRPSTGFQVKKPDMPKAEIITEMRPAGIIRPVIQELADEAGAYVIVSSTGSTADSALRHRKNAMREAIEDVGNSDQLHTDFYDRTRLASWVRQHPGLITWVKEKIGRVLIGWRPYCSWTGAAEGVDAEYLLDDKLRLHLGRHRDAPDQSVAGAIDELRDELSRPGKIVRLVGLSGVGKTRLAQALFDSRIGGRPLPPSLAVYTNLSDNPDPQPIGLASDLIANCTRAVLIVDNCPPDLHRSLSELCRRQTSTVSVLTVEYDVRDDQPEGTQVITLDTSSPELIEKLVRRRYPHLSQVDARTIAEFSGGNARISIALAETVGRSDTVAGLSDEELFHRLFRQRQDSNDALLLAAQACSLVYSFHGEALTGDEAELPRLAALVGQAPAETYRQVGELLRRDLVQQRGVWRAVLPHAIANRLAARALDDFPFDLINQQLVQGGTERRLARSFSRRLSFLHDHDRAIAIVERWLAPDGYLGDLAVLNDLERAIFENVAPVLPEAALAALERAGGCTPEVATMVWQRHLSLLRSLAYDPPLFERSARLLAQVSIQIPHVREAKEAADTIGSLFTIYLSGTHASIEQRLGVIEQLLKSLEPKAQTLGLAALGNMLKSSHFSSSHRFEFGARSRNYGYYPRNKTDVTRWYSSALTLVERLALNERVLKFELRNLVAQEFRGLWTHAGMHNELERLSRKFAADGFWREGWAACRKTMLYSKDRLTPEVVSLLSALEAELRPTNLSERVRAVVLADRSSGLDLEDMIIGETSTNSTRRLEAIVRELGAAVAGEDEIFTELLPALLSGRNNGWSFGRGLAAASQTPCDIWVKLVRGLESIHPEERNVQVLSGFLSELWDKNRQLAQELLDTALDQPALAIFLPILHSAVGLDKRGAERLKKALHEGKVPVQMYVNLAFGGATDHLEGGALKDLVLLIADQADGFGVALEILHMRLFSDSSAQREIDPKLIEAGRELLRRISFNKENEHSDYELAGLVKICLSTPHTGPIAADIASRLRQAVVDVETHSWDNLDLLKALLEVHPTTVLDALFDGVEDDEGEQPSGISVFSLLDEDQHNPMDAVSCETLISWCEKDCERRYPIAATIIKFANRSEASGPLVWSEQAVALLGNAHSFKNVLTVFIDRFQPMSWSGGSLATLMEANAQLLDRLESFVSSDLMAFVTESKIKFAGIVAKTRQWETKHDRVRDEKFE